MNVEVAVLGSSSLISLVVSVDVKHHVYLQGDRLVGEVGGGGEGGLKR